MGVAVRRYIDNHIIIITFPCSTCIISFIGSRILIYFFVHFKNVFSFLSTNIMHNIICYNH